MLPIDYKNRFMYENGYKMQCKICHKTVSRENSCSYQGINNICDNCRGLLCNIFRLTTGEMMIKIQEAGKQILEEQFNNEEEDNG